MSEKREENVFKAKKIRGRIKRSPEERKQEERVRKWNPFEADTPALDHS
jgi:hypothetical protein